MALTGVRWLLFAGKGGVGKTTGAAASVALSLAGRAPDRSGALFSSDPNRIRLATVLVNPCLTTWYGPRRWEDCLASGRVSWETPAGSFASRCCAISMPSTALGRPARARASTSPSTVNVEDLVDLALLGHR